MKKAMTEYISVLSDSNFDILEKIMEKKYQKFLALYWMLKDYSDYVYSLRYKDTDDNNLEIEVELSGVKVDKVVEDLQESINDDNCLILINNKKNKINIEITKEEY